MSDLNTRIAKALGYIITTKVIYIDNGLGIKAPPLPLTIWIVIDPNGNEMESKQLLSTEDAAVQTLPDWEHDIQLAANLARSTGQMWEIHDLRSEGFVCKIKGAKILTQNDNAAIAICEAVLKWYEMQPPYLNTDANNDT